MMKDVGEEPRIPLPSQENTVVNSKNREFSSIPKAETLPSTFPPISPVLQRPWICMSSCREGGCPHLADDEPGTSENKRV